MAQAPKKAKTWAKAPRKSTASKTAQSSPPKRTTSRAAKTAPKLDAPSASPEPIESLVAPPAEPVADTSVESVVEPADATVADDATADPVVESNEPTVVPAQPLPPEPLELANAPSASSSGAPTHNTGRRIRRLAGLLVLLALVVAAALWWMIGHRTSDMSAENRALIAEVSERAVLPSGETPTITTVVDTNKTNQGFLMSAKRGDKVLLYFQASRAFLYRPSTKQIVNIGPLTQPTAQIFLRDGAAGDIPGRLRAALTPAAGYTVVSQDVAARQNYARTLVVDLNGNRPDLAARVAKLVGGTVGSLPTGETPPDADILIIRGADLQ